VVRFYSKMWGISLIVGVVFMEEDIGLGRLEFAIGPMVQVSSFSGLLSGCVCSWAIWRVAICA